MASDPARQAPAAAVPMPAPLLSFDGVDNRNIVRPADPNGDVGPNHCLQWVNLSFAVFDKTTGGLVYGPVNGNTLWSGFGGPCETTNRGDPIVLYDRLAGRWLMSQLGFASFADGPYYQCIWRLTAEKICRWRKVSDEQRSYNTRRVVPGPPANISAPDFNAKQASIAG